MSSNWKDLFEETPPAGHAEQVLRAVQSELEKNRPVRDLWSWRALSAATALGALLGLWVLNKTSTDSGPEAELLGFQDLNAEEVELIAEASEDLELMDDMELLENWEES